MAAEQELATITNGAVQDESVSPSPDPLSNDVESLKTEEHAIVFSNLSYSVKKVQWRDPCHSKIVPILHDVSGCVCIQIM